MKIHQDGRKLQLILLCKSDKEPLRIYELAAVTKGTTSPNYLAARCLQMLAECESKDFFTSTISIS